MPYGVWLCEKLAAKVETRNTLSRLYKVKITDIRSVKF
jgi:hypothetical protein